MNKQEDVDFVINTAQRTVMEFNEVRGAFSPVELSRLRKLHAALEAQTAAVKCLNESKK